MQECHAHLHDAQLRACYAALHDDYSCSKMVVQWGASRSTSLSAALPKSESSAESNDLLGFSCFPSTSCEYTLCTSGAKSSLKRNALRVSWHNACAWASMHAEPARAAAVCSRLYGGLDGDTPA